jgi:CRISPR/Cas system-associated protein Csx1
MNMNMRDYIRAGYQFGGVIMETRESIQVLEESTVNL